MTKPFRFGVQAKTASSRSEWIELARAELSPDRRLELWRRLSELAGWDGPGPHGSNT